MVDVIKPRNMKRWIKLVPKQGISPFYADCDRSSKAAREILFNQKTCEKALGIPPGFLTTMLGEFEGIAVATSTLLGEKVFKGLVFRAYSFWVAARDAAYLVAFGPDPAAPTSQKLHPVGWAPILVRGIAEGDNPINCRLFVYRDELCVLTATRILALDRICARMKLRVALREDFRYGVLHVAIDEISDTMVAAILCATRAIGIFRYGDVVRNGKKVVLEKLFTKYIKTPRAATSWLYTNWNLFVERNGNIALTDESELVILAPDFAPLAYSNTPRVMVSADGDLFTTQLDVDGTLSSKCVVNLVP